RDETETEPPRRHHRPRRQRPREDLQLPSNPSPAATINDDEEPEEPDPPIDDEEPEADDRVQKWRLAISRATPLVYAAFQARSASAPAGPSGSSRAEPSGSSPATHVLVPSPTMSQVEEDYVDDNSDENDETYVDVEPDEE
ncbi:unnamed protein product, partial [Linum tenue]